ncbi:MAG: helix-turn-helix transcriptional regulator [Clostridia bacterium]|nr:helix-turn-helix transcriptional regulator [Clostridia bacterium]
MQREALGKRIREARKQKSFTQQQLAETLGITDVYVSEIERGNKMPSIPLFIAIVEALDISADYLLRDNISSGKPYIYNEFTERLDRLTPKQRKAALDLLDVFIKNLK